MPPINTAPGPIEAAELLKQIRSEKKVTDREGNWHELHSGIDENGRT